jgi:predicted DCC family thiol-disulfide oxidoreductase YuxK
MRAKPVLIYDGECPFCVFWMERWRTIAGATVEDLPLQHASQRFPHLSSAKLSQAIHFVALNGRVYRGAEAIFRSLAMAGTFYAWIIVIYERFPWIATVCETVYRFIAARRPFFSRLTKMVWGKSPVQSPLEGTRRLFLVGLGLCYIAAFVSFGVQIRGLIGVDGIQPAHMTLTQATQQLGASRFFYFPTIAWLSASDGALIAFSVIGALAGLGLVISLRAAGILAATCWSLYLSLMCLGADFTNFQWDSLLLETGFLALFVAPWSWDPVKRTETSRTAMFLVRLLLAKLMLESGLVKLLSGDPTWRNLTSLQFHYWTQPLPTPMAWWIDQGPVLFHQLSGIVLFGIELGAPWLLLGPRNLRIAGATMIATRSLTCGAAMGWLASK